ncbi:TonB-dependent receptor [Aliiglaciecola sp. 2_MG-2023]|uniref:TonB-dependent receptor n=1 Tax=unclassified Aliiglaciecola TaxID=2593648 RepID=UPI0026E43FDF|nr:MULTISPECIES: TonB-dependent receptor [unclassified Aliiglaciecola]MDO6711697.1 TonB-dependent receptor [Aliiglaciecola sp. 2_MG-2023]MDO6752768.1 TonB-dependent receptor [Aliiglaciecola sp. 1_MG-2023]
MQFNQIFVGVSLGLMSLSSAAQTPDSSDSEKDLEVISVNGTYFNDYQVQDASGAMRSNIPLLETAQAVTVIPDTIINEQLATTLGEVLHNDASLSPGTKQRNREVFSSRGFELSSSTGYLRDGHQHWSHYQQPIETLSRVEVIKGPSSILYGQSAPGGLINMVTKKPTNTRLLEISADTDQQGSTRFMLDAGGEITADTTYRAVVVKQDVNFDREYQNGETRERDRFLGSLALEHKFSDDLVISAYYDRTNDKAGLDTGAWLDSNGDIVSEKHTINDFSWAFTDITVENIGAKVTYFFTPEWQVKLGYNEQTFERQRFESSPSLPSGYQQGDSYTSNPYDRFDDWQFKTAFIDLNGEFTFGGIEHNLLFGANGLDYYYGQLIERGDSITFTPGEVEPTVPDLDYHRDTTLSTTEYDYYGVYFQDLMTLNEQWQVAIGGRYDKQNREGADNESLLPKVGVLYHPVENSTIYVNYSEGFEPQSSETIEDELDRNFGMEIDATTSKQIEIGAKWEVSDRLLLNTAIFNIEKSGTLISEQLNDDPDYETVTTQSGLQTHKGFEISAQGAVTDKWFVMTSAMYLHAEYEVDETYQGNTPADAPKWSASIWSRYELSEKLALNAGIFYQGERFADNANTVTKDSYARVDVGATYRANLMGKDVDFRLNIENLLDKDYLAGGGTNNVTIGDGATARLAVKASF